MATADHTIRLSDAAWRRLELLAKREGVTPDEAAEHAVERAFVSSTPRPAAVERLVPVEGPSVLNLVAGLVGTFDGPSDLSTNKAYMEGFGEPRSRRTATPSPAGDDA